MATAQPCGGREPLHPSHQTDIKRNTTACEDLPVKPLLGLQMPECLGDYKDSASQTFMVLTSETSGEGGGGTDRDTQHHLLCGAASCNLQIHPRVSLISTDMSSSRKGHPQGWVLFELPWITSPCLSSQPLGLTTQVLPSIRNWRSLPTLLLQSQPPAALGMHAEEAEQHRASPL